MMIATRAAEGLAAAFVVPMTLAMLSDVFPKGPARNRAFAVWGGVSAAAGTLGLIVGGLLVSAVGWRWIFFINLPVGALVVIASARVLPADAAEPGRRQPFDLIGAVTVTGGASLLAYAIAQATSHPWGSARTISLLSGAAALLIAFVVRERAARHPLLPLSLLRSNSVSGANLVSALLSSAIFAMFYATTLYMQLVLGYSALRTGLYYLPLGVSILLAAGLAPQLVRALGVRFTTGSGAALSAAGLLLFTRIPVHANPVTGIIVPSVITGLGGGLVLVATSIAGLAGVPGARHGVASALLNVSRQLGGALGLAAISTVMATSAAGFGGTAQAALTHGFRTGFTAGVALLIAAVVAAMLMLREDGRGERINPMELQAGA
jgi:predicted MFS family arabinose efflux permease